MYNYHINGNNSLFVNDINGDVVIEADQWKDFPVWKNGRHSVLFKKIFTMLDVLYSPSMNFKL